MTMAVSTRIATKGAQAALPLSLADRINAAVREVGLTYSRFMEGLKAAQCTLDRKILADIAAQDAAGFAQIIEVAKAALKNKPAATLAKA